MYGSKYCATFQKGKVWVNRGSCFSFSSIDRVRHEPRSGWFATRRLASPFRKPQQSQYTESSTFLPKKLKNPRDKQIERPAYAMKRLDRGSMGGQMSRTTVSRCFRTIHGASGSLMVTRKGKRILNLSSNSSICTLLVEHCQITYCSSSHY
jgi:hypothetical protein